jgi:transcription elongation factor Elf1
LAGLFATEDTTVLVRLDLRDAAIREAARQLAEQSKREIVVDADVSDSARVSLRATNVRLGTALDVLSQAAGVRWGRETKDNKTTYRIGKNVPAFTVPTIQLVPGASGGVYRSTAPPTAAQLRALENGLVYSYGSREQRSTFTCPHCKRQATVIRKAVTPKCPKCERVFQSSWQFCPNDGTRRPASETTWKACPFCGKQVSDAALAVDPHADHVPLVPLAALPFVG